MATKQRMGCLPISSIVCACIAALLALGVDPIGGPFIAFLLWLALLPVCFVVALVGAAKKPKPKIAKAPKPPKPPTQAEKAAEAKAAYERSLAIIQGSGLEPMLLEAAKRKAKAAYAQEIDKIMGGP